MGFIRVYLFNLVGIYKITCIKNKRVYIGQSIDIEKRITGYKKLQGCNKQPRLYRSFKKYGIDKHKFDIVTECDTLELNKWERYYQDMYSAMGVNGLNCVLTNYDGQAGIKSIETRRKMSEGKIGYIQTETHRRNNSLSKLGFKHTIEAVEKIRAASTGRKLSEEVKRGISERMKNQVKTDKQRMNAANWARGKKPWNTGVPMSDESKSKMIASKIGLNTGENSSNNKIVFDTSTGVYYFNAKDAAEFNNISYKLLSRYLTGDRRNKTSLVYA